MTETIAVLADICMTYERWERGLDVAGASASLHFGHAYDDLRRRVDDPLSSQIHAARFQLGATLQYLHPSDHDEFRALLDRLDAAEANQ